MLLILVDDFSTDHSQVYGGSNQRFRRGGVRVVHLGVVDGQIVRLSIGLADKIVERWDGRAGVNACQLQGITDYRLHVPSLIGKEYRVVGEIRFGRACRAGDLRMS